MIQAPGVSNSNSNTKTLFSAKKMFFIFMGKNCFDKDNQLVKPR